MTVNFDPPRNRKRNKTIGYIRALIAASLFYCLYELHALAFYDLADNVAIGI